MNLRQHLDNLLRDMADEPSALKVTELAGAKTRILEVRCSKADLGKLVGKSGKTVAALRVLLNALSSKSGRRVSLDIVEAA